MRILIDLQGAQSESRFRGVGRYSLALALGIARNAGEHEIWLLLNGGLAAAIDDIRNAFDGLVPQERIRTFDIAAPTAEVIGVNGTRTRASELLREYVIGQLRPDAVLVTSLFEGYVDDAVISVGQFGSATTTAVILYDLIPYLNPQAYLGAPSQRQYYERKIASLQRAGLLLAISDYSRQEAIDALALDAQRVVAISTAVDTVTFCPGAIDAAVSNALKTRLGIRRAPVMYAPGGFDTRKNIDGLITAYGLLPPALRADHQLIIASKLGDDDRRRLVDHGKRSNLGPDELILTGYVSDAELVALYRSCALFVFPSRHEGFGLPALEAMACGAIVIGADNTSIPEVIGCEEALFNADEPQSIADKITQALSDTALRDRLRRHGAEQAARFSWDASALRALRALEVHVARQAPTTPAPVLPMPGARKPRLAFICPMPPERTGIADYAAQLLPALTGWFDIELVLHQDQLSLTTELASLPQRSVAWFREHAGDYDQILYQFGNSPFHSQMFALLRDHPGVVVLHDFFLSGVLAYEQMTGGIPGAWSDALYHSHGYQALLAGQQDVDAAKETYPCNLAVLEGATRVIVHSEHALTLARDWYGEQAGSHWSIVPLPRMAPAQEDRLAARQALGIDPDTFLVCSFGFIAPTKLTLELLQAWTASSLHADVTCQLVLVGANHGGAYGLELSEAIRVAGAGKRIRIAGWSDETVYRQYLQAADVGVQLRSISRGETSAAVLDCMNYGLATIVNANGSMAALPDDTVLKLDDRFAVETLSVALETLHRDASQRASLGAAARALLRSRHSPQSCAADYAAVLALARVDGSCHRTALIDALTSLPGLDDDEGLLRQLAAGIASAPAPLAQRQLLVDVTNIARHDLKTGIERVVRTQLLELLRLKLPGLRVQPVYLSAENGRWHYRYARRYTAELLGIERQGVIDMIADANQGDIFFGADFSPGPVLGAAKAGVYADWRQRGVGINFMLYDLLPVLRPEFFPVGADVTHADWLRCIAAESDRLVCISDAVADEMAQWLDTQTVSRGRSLTMVGLHLGADIGDEVAPGAPAALVHDDPLLTQLATQSGFLMVGTIEPRKGHLQALDAFEQLWRDGADAMLIIVGNEGWLPLAQSERRTIPRIVERLRDHPELGKRLFWLKGIDDTYLQQIYARSTCLLVPSEGEGFGLPLIEAARYRLPVLARDLPVFREVARDHAHYFSGLDGKALAGAIRDWLNLKAQGLIPVSVGMPWMTWKQNAESLLRILLEPGKERHWS